MVNKQNIHKIKAVQNDFATKNVLSAVYSGKEMEIISIQKIFLTREKRK